MCLCTNHYCKYLGNKQRGQVLVLAQLTSREIGKEGEREGGRGKREREEKKREEGREEKEEKGGEGDKRKLV